MACGNYYFTIFVNEPHLDRAFYLPRLPREYYQGDAVVHWSLRFHIVAKAGWTSGFTPSFASSCCTPLRARDCSARRIALCRIICNLVWMGLRLDSDQLNGMAFLRTHLEPKLAPQKFQHQAHDHVLKEEERKRNAFVRVCNYILENPLRAELVKHPADWPFTGAVVPGYPTLHPLQDDFWPKFWKLYAQAKHPDAGRILRPPIR